MGIRGPKPKGNVKIKWSSNFAYAIGLIASDGCLSRDGRHITFVSKDLDQINNFKKCLNLQNKVGKSVSGYKQSKTFRIQFGDVNFYNFLISIGILPAKSKTINKVDIPRKYILDFIRGCFDGDGYSSSYCDKRWSSSFLFYIVFSSASIQFLEWIQRELDSVLSIKGHVVSNRSGNSCHELRYSKTEALILASNMWNEGKTYLLRKYLKIQESSDIVRKQGN